MLTIYVVFHEKVRNVYSEFTPQQLSHFVFYGVKTRLKNRPPSEIRVIYEEDLTFYRPEFQKLRFNEGTAMYHIFHNRLYEETKYIGFVQYDMKIAPSVLTAIQTQIQTSTAPLLFAPFFAVENSVKNMHGSLQFLVEPIPFFCSGLENYNRCFETNYTIAEVLEKPLVMCNTFITTKELFYKLMFWLTRFFDHKLDADALVSIFRKNPGYSETALVEKPLEERINRGHLIEILTALFFSIEMRNGLSLKPIVVEHFRN
jgi:hypothetical protein